PNWPSRSNLVKTRNFYDFFLPLTKREEFFATPSCHPVATVCTPRRSATRADLGGRARIPTPRTQRSNSPHPRGPRAARRATRGEAEVKSIFLEGFPLSAHLAPERHRGSARPPGAEKLSRRTPGGIG